jgi:hypothetical protein
LFQKNALVPAQLPIDFEEKETVYFRKWMELKKKESVFLSLTQGKHFPLVTLLFLVWLEFSFLWLLFYILTKHGKTRKVNSRNSLSCKQTRPKCVCSSFCGCNFFKNYFWLMLIWYLYMFG